MQTSATLELDAASVALPTEVVAREGEEEERESATKECASDADAVKHLARRVVDLNPTTVSELPSYVLLVGFGICAVVLQVVLKKVARCNIRP